MELISHIYQIFVKDSDSSVYTPPFLVRLMLEESLSWERLDRLEQQNEIILDPSCGSGVFLVEAYKRLVLHWRSRNEWKRPDDTVLKRLLHKVHGIDLEEGAVELPLSVYASRSATRWSRRPSVPASSSSLRLPGKHLHHSCFFDAKEQGLIKQPIGVVTGNPPFTSTLSTPGAKRSYKRYEAHSRVPARQTTGLPLPPRSDGNGR